MVSQINVTPLVDVMLVLLVIFMVTAPIIQQGVEVTLPSVKAEALPGKEEQFVVSITKDSQIYLNDTKLSADELTDKLKAIGNERPDRAGVHPRRRPGAVRAGDSHDGGDQGGGNRKRRDGDGDAGWRHRHPREVSATCGIAGS